MDQKFFHSVRLDKEKCKGCTNCLKRCPTEAIRVRTSYLTKYNLLADKHISANSAMRLDDDIVEAMRKMEQMEDIVRRLPGYDCGSCGSPTCRTLVPDAGGL